MKPYIRKLLLLESALPRTTSPPFIPPHTTLFNDTAIDIKYSVKPYDPSMALTLIILLLIFVCMGFISVYMRRCHEERQRQTELSRRRYYQRRPTATRVISKKVTRGLDVEVVDKIPLFVYKGNAKEVDQNDCAVCLGEFREGESVRMVQCCGHVFHKECIDTWFVSHDSCPLCRSTKLFLEEGSTVVDIDIDKANAESSNGCVTLSL